MQISRERKLLNLGCGSRIHADWVNLDFRFPFPMNNPLLIKLACSAGLISAGKRDLLLNLSRSFIGYNLNKNKPLPFPADYFTAVYSSHLLEHLEYYKALKVISESFRVLQPGGIIRIALPDLEELAREYLEQYNKLKEAVDVELKAGWVDYDRAVTFLLDQMVRCDFWGRMKEFQPEEYSQMIKKGSAKGPLLKLYRRLAIWRRGFKSWGELHKWMYDRVSMRYHLLQAGFTDIRECSAVESRIEGFTDYYLDTNTDGTVYKADSFYMEGMKPL